MTIEEIYPLFKASAGICTDTRNLKLNQLFIALKGPNFNANTLAKKALELGASYAIVDETEFAIDERHILVSDGLETLQALANHHRNQLDATVIAVGGSNGKTTTKELISAVLKTTYSTYSTPGNFNNHIGVPLSLLQVTEEHEFAVIEIGANHKKEHELLCQIAEPDFGLITNNGKDHLEGFGSIDGVIEANAEIYDYLETNLKPAFVNADDHVLLKNSENMARILFGSKEESGTSCQGKITQEFPLIAAHIELEGHDSIDVQSQLFGEFQLTNLLTAACIGHYFDIPASSIKEALEAYKPQNNRTQLLKWKNNEVWLDAYNANPSSLGAMVDSFARYEHPKKGLIIGDMLEMGDSSFAEHHNMLTKIKGHSFELVMCVGEEFKRHQKQFSDYHFFASRPEAQAWLIDQNLKDHSLLIKGSRGLALEKLLDSIEG